MTGTEYDRPKAGHFRQLLYVVMTNKGSTPHSFNSYDFEAIDQKGQTFNLAFIFGGNRIELHYGTMPKGEKRAGWIGFEVPKTTTSLTITWNDGSELSPPAEMRTFHYSGH